MSLPFQPRKILIIKPSSLGDIIHALPVLPILHAGFDRPEIHWVVARQFYGILEDHPLIDVLWIIDKDSWKKPSSIFSTLGELGRLASGLRREKFDLVIDLQGLLRSAMIGLFTGTGARAGFNAAREGARYTYRYKIRTAVEMHAVDKNVLLALALTCTDHDISFPLPPLDRRPEISRLLDPEYAVIVPSAGTLVKRWPAGYFAELVSRLPLQSVIVGAPSDRALADEIVAQSHGRALSIAGRTSLRELASVIQGAKFLVSADSGPMHLAAALDVPVFAIFGPTSSLRTGPYGKIHTVIRKDMPCSPCYSRKPCPDWRCMTEITPDRVLDEIAKATAARMLPEDRQGGAADD